MTLKAGRKKKLVGKRNWFRDRKKQDGDRKRNEKVDKDKTKKSGKNPRDRKKDKDETDRTPAAVIFIPRTQGGGTSKTNQGDRKGPSKTLTSNSEDSRKERR